MTNRMCNMLKVRFGMNPDVRKIAFVAAAIPMAMLALLEGVVHVGESTNIQFQSLIQAEKWVAEFFGNGKVDGTPLLEGILMVAVSAWLIFLVADRYKSHGRLKEVMNSYIERSSRISFQTEALNKHAIISEADADGRYRFVNENWQKVFGYTLAEVIGQKDNLLLDDGDRHTNFDEMREAVRAGNVVSAEQRLRAKSGKKVIAQTTVVPKIDKEGNFLGTVAIRTDVTDARLSESDRFLTSMLKGLQEELYVYSVSDKRIQFMNDLALERCDWAREDSKSKTIFDTSEFFDKSIFEAHVAPLLSGEQKESTIQARHEKGYVEISTTLQTRQDGTPVFVSLLRDITNAKLEEKRRLQNVATVSHELRSPMTSIKGSLRLLKGGAAGNLGEDASRLIDIADRNSDRMLAVLNDILDMEKMVAKKMDYKMERLQVADLVRNAIEMNSGYAQEHSITFVEGNRIDEAWVEADANRLMQVLTNLMSNAAKFSPKHGEVVISVADQVDGWRISVADHGPGIPEEDRDTVFKSFGQAAPVDGKARKGTGLGLAISQKIVAAHHGKLDFESTVGEGTTFFIDLPKPTSDGSPKTKDVAIAAE